MLGTIKQFFEDRLQPGAVEPEGGLEHRLRLATAAVLMEVSWADADIHEREAGTMVAGLQAKFELSREETEELLALARQEMKQAVSHFEFTQLINEQFSPEQKLRVLELAWQVAYADGQLDKHEEHLIRRLADSLHLPHRAFIAAKLKQAPDA